MSQVQPQSITGVFRYKQQNFIWNLALSSSILVGGGVVILLLLYGQPVLAAISAVIALLIASVAIWQIRKQIVTIKFDETQLTFINHSGNTIRTLSQPRNHEVNLRRKALSNGQERLYLQCTLYVDNDIITLEEKIPDGQTPTQLPVTLAPPAPDRYRNTKPFPDMLWSLVQTLGLPENPLPNELIPPSQDDQLLNQIYESAKASFAQYNITAANETFTRWHTLQPDDPIALYNRGVVMLENNLDTAIQDFSLAIQHDPQFLPAYHQRAKAYASQKQWEHVLTDAQTVLQSTPDATLYNLSGIAHHALNQPQQALESYTQAIQLDPNFARAYYNRAVLYQKLGEQEKANADFARAETR